MTTIAIARLNLEDFLDDVEIEARMKRMVPIVAGVFAAARDPRTKRGSRNCITDSGMKLGDLCEYIMDSLRTPSRLFTSADLWWEIRAQHGSREVEALVRRMRRELMMKTLVSLRDTYAIYLHGTDWMICQSVGDESIKNRERVHRVKRDDRSYHGRPKRDRDRRRRLRVMPV